MGRYGTATSSKQRPASTRTPTCRACPGIVREARGSHPGFATQDHEPRRARASLIEPSVQVRELGGSTYEPAIGTLGRCSLHGLSHRALWAWCSSESGDRDDGPRVCVELVEVLADPGAGATVVGPPGEALVHDRRVGLDAPRPARPALPRLRARDLARPCRRRRHRRACVTPSGARSLVTFHSAIDSWVAVAPHPAAVEIAAVGADDDAAEVGVVVDVDGEPAPHLRPAPAARSPRLVAIAAGLPSSRVTSGVDPPVQRPPCSRWPLPTDWRVAASTSRHASRFWPSAPIAGVRASKMTSIESSPFSDLPSAVSRHRCIGSSIS